MPSQCSARHYNRASMFKFRERGRNGQVLMGRENGSVFTRPSALRPRHSALLRLSFAAMSVDDLRSQLRERGYLSHGIERWFALDPWSSRAFWLELATVAAKASLLIALFAVL